MRFPSRSAQTRQLRGCESVVIVGKCWSLSRKPFFRPISWKAGVLRRWTCNRAIGCNRTRHTLQTCHRLSEFIFSFICSGWQERMLTTYMQHGELHDDSVSRKLCPNLEGTDLDSIHKLLARMELATYSTAFSGIDCPGSAMAMLRVEAAAMTSQSSLTGNPPMHLHAVDIGRWFIHSVINSFSLQLSSVLWFCESWPAVGSTTIMPSCGVSRSAVLFRFLLLRNGTNHHRGNAWCTRIHRVASSATLAASFAKASTGACRRCSRGTS